MLTELQCRKAVPGDKPYKLADEKGLHLYVTTTGFKSWRYKYRFDGKEKRLTFGAWPEVSLREARDRRDEATAAGMRDPDDEPTDASIWTWPQERHRPNGPRVSVIGCHSPSSR